MEKLNKGTDLVVSFDTTGSMYPVLAQVRSQVKTFIKGMFDDIPNLRVSVIAHGDYCDKDDPYTIRALDFTSDLKSICEFVSETKQTYGGDADECYELVLYTARTELNWRNTANKVMVMIGDANPHGISYSENVQHLDWRREADILRTDGVKVFAVHALPNFRKSSAEFYKTVAHKTEGTYLTLDQFAEIMDIIKASCISVYSEKKLTEFVSIIRETGRMTNSMNRNIARLTGEYVASEASLVQKDGMISVLPGRFQVMTVDENCAIKEFVEMNGITFKRGRGFYELTKHETVQQYKEVIIQDRETGEMFTGPQVRNRLGLLPQMESGRAKESLSSKSTADFRVFVQSTSFNRKLIAGTTFMYEVEDLKEEIKIPRTSKKAKTCETATVVETPTLEDTKVTESKAEKTEKTKAKKSTEAKKKAEPKKAEPKKAEPKKAEPKKAEPKKAEPKKAEPKKAEPEWVRDADFSVATTAEEATRALEKFEKVEEPAIEAKLVVHKTPETKKKHPNAVTAEQVDAMVLGALSEVAVLAGEMAKAKEVGYMEDTDGRIKNAVESMRNILKKVSAIIK